MNEDEFILTQCDWTKMSIFIILTGKRELILETERRKDVKRAKIVKLTFLLCPKKMLEKPVSFPNQQQPHEGKMADMRIVRPTAIFSCKKASNNEKIPLAR